MFGMLADAHSSASSAIVEDGVIGKMAQTSFTRYATCATAVLPSMVATFLFISARSFQLGDHVNGMAGTLLEAHRTAGTFGVVVAITAPGSQFDDRVLGTGGIAVVAFEAIAAG